MTYLPPFKSQAKPYRAVYNCHNCSKDCLKNKRIDYYMLNDDIWKSIHPNIAGMLCMDCVEKKLGRLLTKEDIKLCPLTTRYNLYTMGILAACPKCQGHDFTFANAFTSNLEKCDACKKSKIDFPTEGLKFSIICDGRTNLIIEVKENNFYFL